MSKVFAVFGASGTQGGSVVRTILANPTLSKVFRVRAITRDESKASIKEFTEKGVEIVKANMSSAEAAASAVQGAHTVFLMTNFWETMSADTEIAQGKAVADACKAAGVEHLIFSSLIGTTKASKGRLPNIKHFDSKAKIEAYIRDSGLPATFVLPGMFMDSYSKHQMIRKGEDGMYTLALPIDGDKAQIPLFDATGDTGKFVAAAIQKDPSGSGKHIYAATDYFTPKRLMAEFSEVIGKPAEFVQIPAETFKSFLPPAAAQELLENMYLLEDPGYYAGADLSESLSMLDEKPMSWKMFVEDNKQQWL